MTTEGISHIPATVAAARDFARTGQTHARQWRVAHLGLLERILTDHQSEWESALESDLGKHPVESAIMELGFVLAEIRHARRHLRRWMRGTAERVPLAMWPARARTRPEPRGTVLIMAPWNYPLQLLLAPLVGALAAGNTVVLKPSELAPATSALTARLFAQYMDPRAVAVVEGDALVATTLVNQDWDYIFYTGGDRVARLIARSAGERLIPTTLELGGKSPAFVDGTGSVSAVADRLVWAKFVNAGQTCVAPDYVLVTPEAREPLIRELGAAIARRYGDDPATSADFGRIVTEQDATRLGSYLKGTRVLIGGRVNAAQRLIEPTVVTDVPASSPLMTDEIFGPILPIIEVADHREAIDFIAARPTPLAMAVMSADNAVWADMLAGTRSGAIDRNVGLAHMSVPGLPFGGVGLSGYGAYHGKRSFDTFSHERAVLTKPLRPDTLRFIYPPYSPRTEAFVRRVLRRLT